MAKKAGKKAPKKVKKVKKAKPASKAKKAVKKSGPARKKAAKPKKTVKAKTKTKAATMKATKSKAKAVKKPVIVAKKPVPAKKVPVKKTGKSAHEEYILSTKINPALPIARPGSQARIVKREIPPPKKPAPPSIPSFFSKAKKKKTSEPEVPPAPVDPEFAPPPPPKKVVNIIKSTGVKKKPEPPGKYVFEYLIHSAPSHIFELISTPSGLTEWFAEDVIVRDGLFIFMWDGIPNRAKMVNYKDDKLVRFKWVDKADERYFEFRLEIDELTNEVSLYVTDFLEEGADIPSTRLLWDKQISNLKHLLGS